MCHTRAVGTHSWFANETTADVVVPGPSQKQQFICYDVELRLLSSLADKYCVRKVIITTVNHLFQITGTVGSSPSATALVHNWHMQRP